MRRDNGLAKRVARLKREKLVTHYYTSHLWVHYQTKDFGEENLQSAWERWTPDMRYRFAKWEQGFRQMAKL